MTLARNPAMSCRLSRTREQITLARTHTRASENQRPPTRFTRAGDSDAGLTTSRRYSRIVRVVVSDEAADLIEDRGGQLYVWLDKRGCCRAVTTLATSSKAPERQEFRRADAIERFELFLPAGLAQLPTELHVAARRFPRRIEAYWEGCAWVVF